MKKFFKLLWLSCCIVLALVFLISSFSAFIPPSVFNYISLFAIGFPYILAIAVIFCIAGFFIDKRTGILLLVLLPFSLYNLSNTVAFKSTAEWKDQKEDSALRVMTWNVEAFITPVPQTNPRAETRVKMLQTINKLKPDILCLQEYENIEGAKKIVSVKNELDSLGYHYSYCSNDQLTKRWHAVLQKGVAILSKIPLIDTGRIRITSSSNEEYLAYADLRWNDHRIRIFTAHLVSFYLYNDTSHSRFGDDIYSITYNKKRSIQSKIRVTEIEHEEEVKVIRRLIDKSPYPVIYCGDMNTTPSSYNYRILKDDLQDAFLQAGFGLGNTFYKIAPTLRIDVCLVDKKFEVLQCKVVERKLSDHYPVIADLRLKQ